MGTNNQSSGGNKSNSLGFVGILTIVFIVLKLCKVISWSWLWVLSPVWITVLFWVIVATVYCVYCDYADKKKGKK